MIFAGQISSEICPFAVSLPGHILRIAASVKLLPLFIMEVTVKNHRLTFFVVVKSLRMVYNALSYCNV